MKSSGLGGFRPPFVYYPPGSSMGFPIHAIRPGSRVAVMFEAEHGPGSLQVAKDTPGWHPALLRRA
ncbi:MAG: hypothetical protein MUF27_09455 [Acidobacteria bacterium]|nr:hypothetical protein [Acidobacteriota bacterium]